MNAHVGIFHRVLCAVLAALVVVGTGLPLPLAHAANPAANAKAKKAFLKGKQLYEEGRYQPAMQAFLEAHRLRPAPGLLFNAALAARKANLAAKAREILLEYLKLTRTGGDAAEIAKAKVMLAEIEAVLPPGRLEVTSRPTGARVFVDSLSLGAVGSTPHTMTLARGHHFIRLELDGYASERREVVVESGETTKLEVALQKNNGRLEITANVPGGEVRVDGRLVGNAPLGPIATTPGDHRVEVSLPGYKAWSGDVRVTLGEASKVEAVLVAIPHMPRKSLRPYVWTTLGVGLAGVIIGGALGGVAKSKEGTVQGASGEFSKVQGDDALGRRLSAAGVAMLVVGGAGLVTSGILFLIDRRGQAAERAPSALGEGRFYAQPQVAPGLYGLTAGGRF
jgi:hypothetical protein